MSQQFGNERYIRDERYKHGYGGKESEQVNNTGTEQKKHTRIFDSENTGCGFSGEVKEKTASDTTQL